MKGQLKYHPPIQSTHHMPQAALHMKEHAFLIPNFADELSHSSFHISNDTPLHTFLQYQYYSYQY